MVEQPSNKSARKSTTAAAMKKLKPPEKKKKQQQQQTAEPPPPESPSYRLALKSLFSCRNSSAPSICKVNKDNEQKPPATDEATAKRRASSSSSSTGTGGGSFRAVRRLSGCYECHMVVDPIFRDNASSSSMFCPCPDCGEIFVRQESLQLHQSIMHAVCELGAEDTSRNIIEIIFQSSWLKKQSPVCRIERILKVHNTSRTLARFEEYRDAVKAKAAAPNKKKKHPRCTADGNELLRFRCAALACSLGLHGATHLCDAASCAACAIIRDGFNSKASTDAGIKTMATSGRAHDAMPEERSSRAMLVCRVIAGRVKRPGTEEVQQAEDDDEYESVAGSAGVYSNMEELQVFNPRAILPCFVVIYKAP